jgi:antitoxin YxxD
MFEYLKEFVGKPKPPNRFWALSEGDIEKAEERLGFSFPLELRTFFTEIGCGFFAQGMDDKRRDRSLINGILSPGEIADILTDPTHLLRPGEGFPPGVIPFFDIGENSYLVVALLGSNRVYWPGARKLIAESPQDFFQQLYRHAGFYRKHLMGIGGGRRGGHFRGERGPGQRLRDAARNRTRSD